MLDINIRFDILWWEIQHIIKRGRMAKKYQFTHHAIDRFSERFKDRFKDRAGMVKQLAHEFYNSKENKSY